MTKFKVSSNVYETKKGLITSITATGKCDGLKLLVKLDEQGKISKEREREIRGKVMESYTLIYREFLKDEDDE
ncbi:hypothetical protein V9J15_02035 [Candidatus Liberibacter africanus]|uniref:hypothetical protein n=1 Tax=Liberibacter africanus TaxID=34020 RepID=UPI00339D3CC8